MVCRAVTTSTPPATVAASGHKPSRTHTERPADPREGTVNTCTGRLSKPQPEHTVGCRRDRVPMGNLQWTHSEAEPAGTAPPGWARSAPLCPRDLHSLK